MKMEMAFRYSEQVEKCHFGQKSDIHFQLKNERQQLIKQKSATDSSSYSLQSNSKKKILHKSSTIGYKCTKHANFYSYAKKLSIFDDEKCDVTLLGSKDCINIYHSKCKFSDLSLIEPDAIIPYKQIRMIKFSSTIERLNVENDQRSLSVELNSKIPIIKPQYYKFQYSDQHIVSAKQLKPNKLSTQPFCSELLHDDSKQQYPLKKRPKFDCMCIFGLWNRIFGLKAKKNNFHTSFHNDNTSDYCISPLSDNNKLNNKNGSYYNNNNKLNLLTISKLCHFQTHLPIQNINLNTTELFESFDETLLNELNLKVENINNNKFLPAKPQEPTHTFMIIYVNPDCILCNPKKNSTLNLLDLRFKLPSYSAILLKRFVESCYHTQTKDTIDLMDNDIHECPLDQNYYSNKQESWVDNTEVYVPPIDPRSRIMTSELYIAISDYLPPSSIYQKLSLLYSSDAHGTSLKTLYSKCQDFVDDYGILLIKENTGNVFGAILSQLPKISRYYYGNGSSSVFQYNPITHHIKNFKWSGLNMYIVRGDTDSISIGGGKTGASIWIYESLIHGRTNISETFLNEQLSENENFTCNIVELWTFEPY